ncbi:4Fe-4S dicluster domain-containing protein, partial [Thermodesulfobacteriota bacterium]
MVIDTTKCNGCYNCFLACKDEFCGNNYSPYSAAQPYTGHFWMRLTEKERGKLPKVKMAFTAVPCMQCENATCIDTSQDNGVYRRPDGIVIIDPEKAAGREEIISSCPYRVIYWNEEEKLPQKCTFCAHLLDKGWKEPRCVEACPTNALIFGDLDDPDSEISKITASENLEELHPEYGLKPGVKYIGLPKRFIAGSVVLGDQKGEWAENVEITLIDSTDNKTVKTDSYGDFEFEGLKPDQEYSLKVEYQGYTSEELNVRTNTDVFLGEIILSPNN